MTILIWHNNAQKTELDFTSIGKDRSVLFDVIRVMPRSGSSHARTQDPNLSEAFVTVACLETDPPLVKDGLPSRTLGGLYLVMHYRVISYYKPVMRSHCSMEIAQVALDMGTADIFYDFVGLS